MKKILSALFLSLFLFGCASAPVVIDSINSIDPNYYKKKYFDGKKLSNIEGIWKWSNSSLKVAIVKNDLDVETKFEYLGIILDAGRWSSTTPVGSVKLFRKPECLIVEKLHKSVFRVKIMKKRARRARLGPNLNLGLFI